MNSNSQSGSSAEVIDNSLDLVAFKRKTISIVNPGFPSTGTYGVLGTRPQNLCVANR